MVILITIIHIIVCFFLIIVVLLQSGKSGDIAAAFGGMGSQTAFGPRGSATVLSKATTWSTVIFMLTSITLSIMASRGGSSSNSVLQGSTPSSDKNPAGNPAQPRQRRHRNNCISRQSSVFTLGISIIVAEDRRLMTDD